jgi:hypothetical protein
MSILLAPEDGGSRLQSRSYSSPLAPLSEKTRKLAIIHISERDSFPCPVGVTAGAAVGKIRSVYNLRYGGLLRNGVSAFENEIISVGGDYHFVNFRENRRKTPSRLLLFSTCRHC